MAGCCGDVGRDSGGGGGSDKVVRRKRGVFSQLRSAERCRLL